MLGYFPALGGYMPPGPPAAGPPPAVLSTRPTGGVGRGGAEDKLQKRKQANRDSARRSKIRKKEENEHMLVRARELEEKHDSLTRQYAAARERTSQLTALNVELKQQLAELGITVP